MSMSQRRDCSPVLVQTSGQAMPLERIPFTERRLEEGWLQRLLHDCPSILPVEELDPAFAPLIPLGREIATEVGPIDVLYGSSTGALTIVEAKLWRNPEARRQVVGQIIDYAKELASWTYEELDAAVRASTGRGIWDMVKQASEEGGSEDEAAFVDRVSRNLRNGRFLLIVAGDGIHESVENMVSFLQSTPQLQFTLALVELQLYRVGSSNDSILVVPQIVARTAEITRAVVRIESTGAAPSVNVTVDLPVEDKDRAQRRTLSEEEFLELLSEKVPDDQIAFAERLLRELPALGLEPMWRSSSCVFRLPDPGGSSQLLTTLVVNRNGDVYVGWLKGQLEKVGLPFDPGRRYVEEAAQLLKCRVKKGYPDSWEHPASLATLMRNYDGFLDILRRFITEVRALAAQLQEQ